MDTASSHLLLSATLDKLVTATGGGASLEAALLSQANVLALLFKYQVEVALTHRQGSEQADRAIQLAMKAQAQSARILTRLLQSRRPAPAATAPVTEAPSSPPAGPVSAEPLSVRPASPAPSASTVPPEAPLPRPFPAGPSLQAVRAVSSA
jgi:hypothetical protein